MAVELYKTIIDRESFAQEIDIYQEIFATYDSMNIEKDELIELQKIRAYEAEKEMLAEKNRHQETIAENKKQKRRLIFSFSSITIIAVLTSILVSR